MFFIGISLIVLGIVGLIALVTFIIPLFLVVGKGKRGNPPRKISYAIVCLLIFHWIFFLVNGYALLPTTIAEVIFIPVWLILCAAGAFSAIYEFKNNKLFAIPVGGLTTISLLLTIFSYGISKM